MKSRILVLMLLAALCILPVLGQNTPQATSTVSFNGISFAFDSTLATNVNIVQKAATGAQDMPAADAAHTEFQLYNQDMAPASAFETPAVINVYRVADLAGMDAINTEFQTLQTLLTTRGDLTPFTTVSDTGDNPSLPFLPLANAAQAIHAKVMYVDTTSLQGVSYITIFRQDVSDFVGNEFVYTFQGLSWDGVYYVSAVFHLNTALFPQGTPSNFDATTYPTYLRDSIAQLTTADPTAFTPSLTTADALIQSFSFGGLMTGTAIPTIIVPVATSTVVQDPSLGGLSGTWTLVSYGAADAQIPVLPAPATPITLTFATDGISGNGGCNSYGGAFQYNAGTLTISNVVTTLMACQDDVTAQETTYLDLLGKAASYQVNGTELVITTESGLLMFTNAPAPTATVPETATSTETAVPVETMTPTATP